jgi:phosphoribosylamine--glycine ligase/phosphoribosylformylglycinamidine cyclo-ligase
VLLLSSSCDLAEIMLACVERRLDSVSLGVEGGRHAVSVVLASEGYPGKYEVGKEIRFGDVPEGEWKIGSEPSRLLR